MSFNYGLKIKKLMEAKGFKQIELSKKLGVTPAFVNQLILGRRMPGRSTLLKIADALDIHVNEMLPPEAGGGVPLLFGLSGKGYCEFTPENWKAADVKPDYIPLPTGYTLKAAEREGVFAVSIDSNRYYPILRKDMVIYLRPLRVDTLKSKEYSVLTLFRDVEGYCSMKEIEFKSDGVFLLKDLLTGNSLIAKELSKDIIKGSLYQVISIVVK